MVYDWTRRALFALDAETAHDLTLATLRFFPRLATSPYAAAPVEDPVRLLGLRFRNRLGLAAGLDKNGECLAAWNRLGFGFVEVGTVTPRPQRGNPKPRMFRLAGQQALINRLGFNNQGVDRLVARVAAARSGGQFEGVLGINIGKNADTPIGRAAEDYLACLSKVHAVADYVTVNVSSPNTRNLRDLQDETRLDTLLAALAAERERLAQSEGRRVPMLVKISPDVSPDQLEAMARIARERGVDGLIATNTTISRPGLADDPASQAPGGLSGAPLRELSTELLRRLRGLVGPDYPLIGVGGVLSGADAVEKRAAGADLVQVYTGFIYRGPALVGECAGAMARAA